VWNFQFTSGVAFALHASKGCFAPHPQQDKGVGRMSFVSRTLAPHSARGFRNVGMVWILAFALAWTALLTGCGGDHDDGDQVSVQAPAGLTYSMPAAVYETGQPIATNRPSASGSPVDRYSVNPALPTGLELDPTTGVITGTPVAASAAVLYVVTAQNAAGSTTARVQIEVRSMPAQPAGLTYRETAATYAVGVAIAENPPSSTGGPIVSYGIAPALPTGLTFDTQTGTIAGTPTVAAADDVYTITGSNAAGSVTTTLHIAVLPVPTAPSALTYSSPVALYVTTEPIAANTPAVTGGTPTSFSVTPALPTGLSLNTTTGVIAGTAAAIQSEVLYTITASNDIGSIQTQVRISVTARGSWTPASAILSPANYMAAATLADGRVLLTGGTSNGTIAQIYDPAANTWTATGNMNVGRYEHTLTVLADGRALATGGGIGSGNVTDTAEIYSPVTGTWQVVASMHERRTTHTATLLPDGRVMVLGGNDGTGSGGSDTAEVFDPVANTWTLQNTRLVYRRGQGYTAQFLPEHNAILVVGLAAQPELFPIDDSGTSTVAASVPIANSWDMSVRLNNGKILVMGWGSATAWLYDPALDNWTSSTMSTVRTYGSLTPLSDGRALAAGGSADGSALDTAEIYNPDTNLWTAAANMASARRVLNAVSLSDGSALVMNGYDVSGTIVPTAERYRP